MSKRKTNLKKNRISGGAAPVKTQPGSPINVGGPARQAPPPARTR